MVDKKEIKKFLKECDRFYSNVKKSPLKYGDGAKDILKKISKFKEDKDIMADEKLKTKFNEMEKTLNMYLINIKTLGNIDFGIKK